ncbi:DNA polymerase III subunit alpha [Mycoplasma sp. SG1]|uniref:DNA polymerase III subunit alpha n=1 Tax=Mycoplasma sp. SG1 TaxID=2810348 RepID=UPI0020252E95|nr:DNA polymerase III subunit alpha [Mycoplasma sp. SG1]URM52800.1 DNA polymerase III subunit alpha [Mycoplasma sp. SG1]
MLDNSTKLNCNINARTCYSFYRSIIKPDELVKHCVNNNFKQLVFTDINNFSAAPYLVNLCKNYNIQLILGMEAIIDDYALLLFPLNQKGYQNLAFLCSLLNQENKEISWDDCIPHLDDLVIVIKSLFFVDFFKSKLGQTNINSENIFYSHKLNLTNKENILFLQEVNYFFSDDKKILDLLKNVREKKKFDDFSSFSSSEENKFLTIDELQKHKEWKEVYHHNLKKFYNKIKFDYGIKTIPIIKYSSQDSNKLLEEKAYHAFDKFLKIHPWALKLKDQYKRRLEKELEIIKKLNFADYFLIVSDFIDYANKNNILYGPGRGSAVGALLCYLLKITKIDPLKYDLIFERFMNLSRVSPPDIDIDFDSNERNKIINYIFKRFGLNHVAYIGTYSFVKAKTAIRDVGRVLGVDIKYINLICKDLDPECVDVVEHYKKNLVFFNSIYPYHGSLDFLYIANKIIGIPRQFGMHPAGVILSQENIKKLIPLNVDINGFNITQYDNLQLAQFNVNKIDILGIKNISIIKQTLLSIEKHLGERIDLDNINFEDPVIFWEYARGNTNGIFQLESSGVRRILSQLKVSSLNDVIITISLYRPGPMDQRKLLINRKKGITPIDYIVPELKPVLENTYGIILFQEQIMLISQIFANFSLEEADNFRRGIAKKDHKIFEEYKDKFIQQAVQKGHSLEVAVNVFNMIEKFADYGFNKSHAVGYSILGYQMFYLKVYYPLYFFCELLNHYTEDTAKTYIYLKDFERKYSKKYKIIPFDIFNPSGEYQVIDNKLQFGLFMVKGLEDRY